MAKSKKYTTVPFTVVFDSNGKAKINEPFTNAVKLKKGQSFFWHNINYQSEENPCILCSGYGIDEDTAEALTELDTRPRYFTTPKGVVFILRAVNSDPNEEDDLVSVRFWVDKNKIISFSSRR
ncbi:MAG: hypothetical protein LBL47_03335, partial [Lactobacillus sp.]|nr:hypothetical protein [Lactobacillus sp.]